MSKPKRLPMVERLKNKLKNNPKVNLVDMNIPLTDGSKSVKLKDVLEEGPVDDKYYVKQEIVEKIIQETDFTERLVSIKIEKESK